VAVPLELGTGGAVDAAVVGGASEAEDRDDAGLALVLVITSDKDASARRLATRWASARQESRAFVLEFLIAMTGEWIPNGSSVEVILLERPSVGKPTRRLNVAVWSR